MISKEKIFGNLFDDKNITPGRLLNFGRFALNAFTIANDKGQFTWIINILTAALDALEADLGAVDTALTVQIGATDTVDGLRAIFHTYMSDNEPFIAKALGGRSAPAFLEIYPHKISEYNNISKTEMPVLTNRVSVAAGKYAAQLGPDMTAELQSFEKRWHTLRGTQQTQMGSVKNNRSDKKSTLLAAQLALTGAVHCAGALYPGNVEACGAFFPFHTIYTYAHHRHTKKSGTAAPQQQVKVLNSLLTDTATITFRNTGTGASFAVWLAADEQGTAPAGAKVVKPGESLEVKPSELGDLHDSFLLLLNTSEVNEAQWEAELVGVKE